MKNIPSQPRFARRLSLVLSACAAFSIACGQVITNAGPTQLDPVISSATRTATLPQNLGSAVDSFSAAEFARRQIASLSQALGGVAGAPHFATGATGGTTSLFLRGANSNQTLFLVDGLRLNDPNTDYQVFLGGACLAACDSLEVAHGPQSTLYGGEAIGGVISLRALRGEGPPSGSVAVEGGSFGTVQGAVSAQGARGATAYNFSAQGGHTDNDRANNSFGSANSTLRLDHTVNERVTLGATARWFHGVYGDPGDRYTNDPDNQTREENLLLTAFADVKLAADWNAHVVLGGQDRRFVAESPRANRATSFTVVKNRRAVLDTQTTYSGIEGHRFTSGFTAEGNHTRNTGFGNINKKQVLFAVFAQDEFSPAENLFLTAGLRSDDFDTFGRATTGRATAAWLVAQRSVKFRASYGTAFRSPSFLDLYGRSSSYVGNPNLRAEKGRGWDAGVDYYLPQRRGTLSATWFETDYRDLIIFNFAVSPSTVINVERARTRGMEFSAQTTLPGAIEIRASYSYLEADNLTQSKRLLRRPRHSANVDAWHDFGRGFSAGAGVAIAAQREDVHARTFATIDGEDYAVARLYTAYRVNDRLTLKARAENLLNEKYEEVNGYPALGLGVFGGVEWKF
ncbi:MAG TPA: TonB-dependent receptor [Opitutaceae bacterium]|nr:TonB-dependent receptor [Opitutaceae bacterium]